MALEFNVIGAGRLGIAMAFSLISNQLAELVGVCNANPESAQGAVKQLGFGKALFSLIELTAAPLTLITVPDDQIVTVVKELANLRVFSPGDLVIHCSGVLSSAILSPLADQGCLTASLHPLRAFNKKSPRADCFNHCDCIMEGDALALAQLTPLFQALGAQCIPIEASQKAAYHAAATMAANYLVTLAAESLGLLEKAGINELLAKQMLHRLMRSSLDNIEQAKSMEQALTGPLCRGDIATIEKHLQAIDSPDTVALYRAAGLATLPLTRLNLKQQQALKYLLRPDKDKVC